MWCDGADLSNDMQVVKSEASRIRDVSELSRPTNAPPGFFSGISLVAGRLCSPRERCTAALR